MLPLADRSETASQRWQDFTAPSTERWRRSRALFVSLNAKKPIEIHNLKDALALQGKISLSGKDAVEVNVEADAARWRHSCARSRSTSTRRNGWKVNVDGDVPLAAGDSSGAARHAGPIGARQELTINVKVRGRQQRRAVSVGQPCAGEPASAGAPVGDRPTSSA